MAHLLVESGPLAGKRIPLDEGGESLSIGRGRECDLRLPGTLVSRLHCLVRFSRSRNQWVLKDQQSSNGTFVNSVPVVKNKLTSGDVIRVGDSTLSFYAEESDPLVGATLAGCRIESRLGRGGSGTVYRGLQISLDRAVAVKILAPNLAGDEGFVRRFLKEARAAARLNHPNVVQVYDAGEDSGYYYILMEFVEGGTIQDLLARERRLPVAEAVNMALQVADALTYAERNQLVHRDIKPANLLLDSDGVVKVGDLGIACDLASRSDSSIKRVGSPRYMAPEQVETAEADHRADIYALGATLYHALAGVPPFDGKTVQAIVRAKVERDPQPLSARVPDLSSTLSNAVRKMMARDPEKRYPNAAAAKRALERAVGVNPGAERRFSVPLGLVIGIGAGAVLLILCILLWMLAD